MESVETHGRSVVPKEKGDAWKCKICGDTPQGGNNWRCASKEAVMYYIDPRNWMDDTHIFEFENLSYNEEIHTIDGVKKIIAGIEYMNGDSKVTYTKTDGTIEALDKSYSEIIMEAAKSAKISPYHLVLRIMQEQGRKNIPGSTATGTYEGYVGYYNFLNIEASGSTDREITINGLETARNNKWTNPEISIIEGAKILAKYYINDGQDTLYLQKFDVDDSDNIMFWYQYMQNLSAPLTESEEIAEIYKELNIKNSKMEFIIPVYENMPKTKCEKPVLKHDVNGDEKINSSDAVAILKYITKKREFTEVEFISADVNEDGKVNSKDAVLILKYIAKKIAEI